MKALSELSPREIEHDNPQIRRVDEMRLVPLAALQPRGERGRRRHGDPLQPDRRHHALGRGGTMVPPRARPYGGARNRSRRTSAGRARLRPRDAAHRSMSAARLTDRCSEELAARTARRTPRTRPRRRRRSAPRRPGSDGAARLRTAGRREEARPRTPGSSGACAHSEGRRPPSRRASSGAPPGSSCASASPRRPIVGARGAAPRPGEGDGRSR